MSGEESSDCRLPIADCPLHIPFADASVSTGPGETRPINTPFPREPPRAWCRRRASCAVGGRDLENAGVCRPLDVFAQDSAGGIGSRNGVQVDSEFAGQSSGRGAGGAGQPRGHAGRDR